jgi:hypothetical protein
MKMNEGLNDRATALNTDGECCRLRELEEGKEVSLRGLTCVRFKLNSVRLENKYGLSLLRVQRRPCPVCR